LALTAAAAAGAFSSFLSGNPNLAARLASTSSLIPKGALSIAPTFSFFSTAGVEAAAAAGVGFDFGLDAVGVGFGLNAIPNLSARDFIACCSGVNVCSVVDSGAGAEVVYHQLWSTKRLVELTGAVSVAGCSSSGAV
jgi:hypothetical protein